jgi:hypothetical protein
MRNFILPLILVFVLFSCDNDESPIEGSWNMIETSQTVNGSVTYSYPGNVIGDQIKLWSDQSFCCAGKFELDSATINNYAGGSYTLNGKEYVEHIRFHASSGMVGQTVKMELELHGDTLIQRWPLNDDGKIDPDNCSMEKYVRID